MALNNIRGRKIHWERGRPGAKELDKLFLRRLASAETVIYHAGSGDDRGSDLIEVPKSRRHGTVRISPPALARLLGFAEAVSLPDPPTFEECQAELLGRSDVIIQSHFAERRIEANEPRARKEKVLVGKSISGKKARPSTIRLTKTLALS